MIKQPKRCLKLTFSREFQSIQDLISLHGGGFLTHICKLIPSQIPEKTVFEIFMILSLHTKC